MPRLSFKFRRGARTAQLVRHVYSPARKRSVAVAVGSIRIDSDPDLLPAGLRLANGQELSADDLAALRAWLERHGDSRLAAARAVRASAIREQALREATRSAETPEAACAAAVRAIEHASGLLTSAARLAAQSGTNPRSRLRAPYLAVYRAWTALQSAASQVGIAKVSRRSSRKGANPS
jgi:hypothetical protein